jgi:hypothetical protein
VLSGFCLCLNLVFMPYQNPFPISISKTINCVIIKFLKGRQYDLQAYRHGHLSLHRRRRQNEARAGTSRKRGKWHEGSSALLFVR